MEKTLKELKADKEALETKVKTLTEAADEKNKEELETMTTQLSELDKSIKTLEEAEVKKLEEAKAKKLEEDKKLADKNVKLQAQEKTITKLSEDVKALTGTVKNLMEERKNLKGERYQTSVKDTVRELKDAGTFPATLKVVENFLLSEDANGVSVKLTEGEGDKKKETTKSLADIIKDVLLSIPEDHRFTDSEESRSEIDSTGNKELSEADVQEFADKKKITFEEALIQLSKDGKIS